VPQRQTGSLFKRDSEDVVDSQISKYGCAISENHCVCIFEINSNNYLFHMTSKGLAFVKYEEKHKKYKDAVILSDNGVGGKTVNGIINYIRNGFGIDEAGACEYTYAKNCVFLCGVVAAYFNVRMPNVCRFVEVGNGAGGTFLFLLSYVWSTAAHRQMENIATGIKGLLSVNGNQYCEIYKQICDYNDLAKYIKKFTGSIGGEPNITSCAGLATYLSNLTLEELLNEIDNI